MGSVNEIDYIFQLKTKLKRNVFISSVNKTDYSVFVARRFKNRGSSFAYLFPRYFSHEPHLAGSRRSKKLADEIGTRWNNYGFHVDTLEYNVLLPRAKDDSPDYFELKDRSGNVTMRHEFAAVVS